MADLCSLSLPPIFWYAFQPLEAEKLKSTISCSGTEGMECDLGYNSWS